MTLCAVEIDKILILLPVSLFKLGILYQSNIL